MEETKTANYSNQAQGTCCQTSREKDWEELKDDEKIERLKDIVKTEQGKTERLKLQIFSIRKILSKHEHIDGKVIEKKEITEYYFAEPLTN